ncbi:MAG TPA: hypothetical protein PKD64_07000 [Pirellulaceae bacterium]|nr:hypothetical protein [Pirellulaceae bacterium]HMO91931.1 hypothetical protein [Pirellulaceae bacterium]HMP68730.1 hypothetical protein [Pirellulaceae bacterium]
MNRARYFAGGGIWICILACLIYLLISLAASERRSAINELTRFFSVPAKHVDLKLQVESMVCTYDPIFMRVERTRNRPEFVQVGKIERVISPQSNTRGIAVTSWARAEFFSNAPPLKNAHYLTRYETPRSIDFIVQTLLPEDARRQIAQLVGEAYAEHHQDLLIRLRPILEAGFQEAAVVIHESFLESIERHQQEFEELGARYQIELIQAKLIPLVNREIWPIVSQEFEPLLLEIGEEMWNRASVWRFGWAVAYDSLPLPRRDLVKREFASFLKQHAVPTMVSHMDKIISAQQAVLAKIARNEQVIQVLRDTLFQAAQDAELQRVVVMVLQDVFVNNDRLRRLINDFWLREDTQLLVRMTDEKLEPVLAQIGKIIFGDPTAKVTPEFARVLRANVLKKDHRWFLLEEVKGEAEGESFNQGFMIVTHGGETDANPFDYSLPPLEND